jgi:hypothetical protein
MVCGALRPGRQKGNARPGLGSHARAQRPESGRPLEEATGRSRVLQAAGGRHRYNSGGLHPWHGCCKCPKGRFLAWVLPNPRFAPATVAAGPDSPLRLELEHIAVLGGLFIVYLLEPGLLIQLSLPPRLGSLRILPSPIARAFMPIRSIAPPPPCSPVRRPPGSPPVRRPPGCPPSAGGPPH